MYDWKCTNGDFFFLIYCKILTLQGLFLFVRLTFELFAALYELLHQSGHFWVGCLVIESRLRRNRQQKEFHPNIPEHTIEQ